MTTAKKDTNASVTQCTTRMQRAHRAFYASAWGRQHLPLALYYGEPPLPLAPRPFCDWHSAPTRIGCHSSRAPHRRPGQQAGLFIHLSTARASLTAPHLWRSGHCRCAALGRRAGRTGARGLTDGALEKKAFGGGLLRNPRCDSSGAAHSNIRGGARAATLHLPPHFRGWRDPHSAPFNTNARVPA